MNTKIFKNGLPIMAFLMAIGLAFATEQKSLNEESLITGYIHEKGLCKEVSVSCNPFAGGLCVAAEGDVYEGSLTSCPNRMRDWD